MLRTIPSPKPIPLTRTMPIFKSNGSAGIVIDTSVRRCVMAPMTARAHDPSPACGNARGLYPVTPGQPGL